MKYTTYLLLFVLLSQCQVKHTDNVDVSHGNQPQENVYEGYDTHVLTLIDNQVKIQVPGANLVGQEPQISSSNSGITNMKIGKNFHLEILEGELNMDEVIADLHKDIFYKISVLSQDENRVIYEKSLPDGSQSYVNFMMKKYLKDIPIIIRSASNGQFRRAHVDRMIKSAITLDDSNEIVMNN